MSGVPGRHGLVVTGSDPRVGWIACATLALGSWGPWEQTFYPQPGLLSYGAPPGALSYAGATLFLGGLAAVLLAVGRQQPTIRWPFAGVAGCGGIAAVISAYAILTPGTAPGWGAIVALLGALVLAANGAAALSAPVSAREAVAGRQGASRSTLAMIWLLACAAAAAGGFVLGLGAGLACYDGQPLAICDEGAPSGIYEALIAGALALVVAGGLAVFARGRPRLLVRHRGPILGVMLLLALALMLAASSLAGGVRQ